MSVRWVATAPALAVVAMVTAGCGSARESAVDSAAATFYQAFATQDGAKACDLLAPGTRSEVAQSAGKPCPQALLEEDVPEPGDPLRTDVFGTMAEVRYSGETAFLSRFDGTWKVMAVGCTNPPHQPYDCEVKGS